LECAAQDKRVAKKVDEIAREKSLL